jgi:sulfofructose kinase
MAPDVVGLGIASYDLIGVAGAVPEFGRKQPLAQWIEAGGGPVATALVTLARLGARTAYIGPVGDDAYGPRILAGLQADGVDTSGAQVRRGGSHVAFVLAEPGRDRRTVFWHNDPQVLADFKPDRAQISAARALCLDTHLPDAALTAARWMRAAGGLVLIDAERVRDGTLAILPHCDLIVVSERFGREATQLDDPAAAAQALHMQYGVLAAVTCGAEGSWCAHRGELFHTPAFAVDVVDTTGCGDVFHGALLFALLRGDAVPVAFRFASAVAALKCRAVGGRAGIPRLAEAEGFVR